MDLLAFILAISAEGITDEQVQTALNAYISEHPEAVTTVTDGSITKAKLDSNLQATVDDVGVLKSALTQLNDYVLITSESETESNYNNQNDITKLIVSGNGNAFGNVFLCDRRNVLPSYPVYSCTRTTQPVTAVYNGRFISISGSSSAYTVLRPYADWINVDDFDPGDYKLIIKQSPNFTATETMYVTVFVKGTSGEKNLKDAYIGRSSGKEWDVTIGEGYTSDISFYVHVPTGFDGATKLWIGLFKKPYTIVDTELTVEDGETIEVSIDPENYPYGIDTMQHRAIAEYHPAVQDYLDNHIPDEMITESDLVYISPEMYGAIGDGNTDDTQSIQNCINAAISTNKIVRGYGNYKTSGTITIDGSNLDVFISRITYTGNAEAIKIAGKNNKFEFDTIEATTADTSKGLVITDPTSTDSTERLVIQGQRILAKHNAIKFISAAYLTYVVCRIKQLSSALADAIATQGGITELSVYDCYFNCPNGWCFNGSGVKLFNCTIESNCYGGVYANRTTISNCRARELMDCLMGGNDKYGQISGILFKAKSVQGLASTNIDIDDYIYYDAIDLSDVSVYDEGAGRSTYNGAAGRVNSRIVYGDLNYRYGQYTIGTGMLLHGNDRICIPPFRSVLTVTQADCDMRDENYSTFKNTRMPFVTDFVIGVADCVIHLAPSYCAEGYGDITVDMSDHLATIYDRRGNMIFDPTNKELGKYRLTAIVDHTIDTTYQHKSGQYEYPINSGYCDVWEVTKVN